MQERGVRFKKKKHTRAASTFMRIFFRCDYKWLDAFCASNTMQRARTNKFYVHCSNHKKKRRRRPCVCALCSALRFLRQFSRVATKHHQYSSTVFQRVKSGKTPQQTAVERKIFMCVFSYINAWWSQPAPAARAQATTHVFIFYDLCKSNFMWPHRI